MTRQVRFNLTCPKCGSQVQRSSNFSEWLRQLPPPWDSREGGFSNHNLDFIWHNYKERWVITIEEKTRGGTVSYSQEHTHAVIAAMLEAASGQYLNIRYAGKIEHRPVEYRGHYVVRFQNTTPDDSGWITINDQIVTRQEVLEWLRTGSLSHVVRAAV